MYFEQFATEMGPLIKAELERQVSGIKVESLRSACAHLTGRGKLFRPLLMLATYRALGKEDTERVMPAAASIELTHTFTLIHDDLPCMDDAELRRSVAAVHKEFGEAMAVLAGDALLNLALLEIAKLGGTFSDWTVNKLSVCICEATQTVVEGQVLDLEGEGKAITIEELQRIHRAKTGALISACSAFGAILAEADSEMQAKLADIGMRMGLAFQIRDDLLSLTSTEDASGKTLSTDSELDKATYPRILGADESEKRLGALVRGIKDELNWIGLPEPGLLEEIANQAAFRNF